MKGYQVNETIDKFREDPQLQINCDENYREAFIRWIKQMTNQDEESFD